VPETIAGATTLVKINTLALPYFRATMCPDPSRLRDSTQIVLPCSDLDGIRDRLTEQFTVTVVENDGRCRIVGSPVEINDASGFLARNGVPI
jgi:hypothetical protein